MNKVLSVSGEAIGKRPGVDTDGDRVIHQGDIILSKVCGRTFSDL